WIPPPPVRGQATGPALVPALPSGPRRSRGPPVLRLLPTHAPARTAEPPTAPDAMRNVTCRGPAYPAEPARPPQHRTTGRQRVPSEHRLVTQTRPPTTARAARWSYAECDRWEAGARLAAHTALPAAGSSRRTWTPLSWRRQYRKASRWPPGRPTSPPPGNGSPC